MIVVDTSVWSLALRRPTGTGAPPHAARRLRTLIEDGQAIGMPGMVKQALLSGVRHEAQHDRMLRVLEPFQSLLAIEADHVRAAKVANACRANGVQVGAVDALIVAMTLRLDGFLLTTDRDYQDIHNPVAFNLQWLPTT